MNPFAARHGKAPGCVQPGNAGGDDSNIHFHLARAQSSDPRELCVNDPAWQASERVQRFRGNAEPAQSPFWTQFRTQNRFTLFLELLRPGC
jgi:hypothetical protein